MQGLRYLAENLEVMLIVSHWALLVYEGVPGGLLSVSEF